jgi:predicted phosphoribosyltransferase
MGYPFVPRFRDRADGGRFLAKHLSAYKGKDALVLGIPRGGVPVAAEVARLLDVELDIIVARKLGAPHSPELAIGAVTANGGRYLNEDMILDLGVSPEYVESVTAEETAEAKRREERFRGDWPKASLKNRVAILVDDGLATGATMRAAVRSVRLHEPAKIVVAAPVGSVEACAALRKEADEVVCPRTPVEFMAVGLYYEDFGQTQDAEVCRILHEHHAARKHPEKA